MKTKYENVGGSHTTADGRIIKKGEVFSDPDPDLCDKFPNKFRKVTPATEVPEKADDGGGSAPSTQDGAKTPPVATTGGDTGTDTGSGDGGGQADNTAQRDGDDVTDEFAEVEGTELRVYKVAKGWSVYHGNDKDPLNEKPMLRRDVAAFVEAYLEDVD